MDYVKQIKIELQAAADAAKAAFLPVFFQAFPGGYGEGDRFIGVKVPDQRKVAKKYYKLVSFDDLQSLISDPVHEHRLTALFMLVYRYERLKDEREKREVVDFYLQNTAYVNNWDLVDSSAGKILGAYLFDKEKDILFRLAESGNLWEQRIAVIATGYFIWQGEYGDTLALARLLLRHPHDLIHKAVGWMLREVGNRDFEAEFEFLKDHYREMPRTMLRYAIEKFEPELRPKFLKGDI